MLFAKEEHVTAFPVHLFPSPIRDLIEAMVTAIPADPALAGTAAIGVLSTVLQQQCHVNVTDGWDEGLNTYTLALARTGAGKSPVLNAFRAPLDMLQRQEQKHWKEQLKALKLKARRASSDEKDEIKLEIEEAEKKGEPELYSNDVTNEEVVRMLWQNEGRGAIIDSEGGQFGILGGVYSGGRVGKIDVWLSAFAQEAISVRRGRGRWAVEQPHLTICIMAQPRSFAEIPNKRILLDRGLFARFLFASVPDMRRKRTARRREVRAGIRNAYTSFILRLAEMVADGGVAIPMLPEAIDVLDQFTEYMEGFLRTFDDPDEADLYYNKADRHLIRLAGLLHAARMCEQGAAIRTPMTAATMRDAWALYTYFQHAARQVLAITAASAEQLGDARKVLVTLCKRWEQWQRNPDGTVRISQGVVSQWTNLSRQRAIAALEYLDGADIMAQQEGQRRDARVYAVPAELPEFVPMPEPPSPSPPPSDIVPEPEPPSPPPPSLADSATLHEREYHEAIAANNVGLATAIALETLNGTAAAFETAIVTRDTAKAMECLVQCPAWARGHLETYIEWRLHRE
ncbi:MAG: DUF3987 domain-containing protein [Chloroflexaceae bacterium]|nr:DUF3987 domain-containing protein [Chloroflexaceae bacterium]